MSSKPHLRVQQSLATWAFDFLWLGCASFGAIFFVGPMVSLHLIDDNTAEGLGMALGLVVAPACVAISIVVGVWHLWRKWTGAGEPSIGLDLDKH